MFCGSAPIVTSVYRTPSSARTRFAIDSMIVWVDSRLEPSGARTRTSNWDSSSLGRKFLLATAPSGKVARNVRAMTATTIQRWARHQSRSPR